jgi:hypothetical protein
LSAGIITGLICNIVDFSRHTLIDLESGTISFHPALAALDVRRP